MASFPSNVGEWGTAAAPSEPSDMVSMATGVMREFASAKADTDTHTPVATTDDVDDVDDVDDESFFVDGAGAPIAAPTKPVYMCCLSTGKTFDKGTAITITPGMSKADFALAVEHNLVVGKAKKAAASKARRAAKEIANEEAARKAAAECMAEAVRKADAVRKAEAMRNAEAVRKSGAMGTQKAGVVPSKKAAPIDRSNRFAAFAME